jgi:hypothetical protein
VQELWQFVAIKEIQKTLHLGTVLAYVTPQDFTVEDYFFTFKNENVLALKNKP